MTHVLDREKKGDLSWDQSSASGGKKTALRDLGRGRLLTNSGSVLTICFRFRPAVLLNGV